MNWLPLVFNLLESIPSTFWGVVIGSVFTLGGVMLSNRANDRRLHSQFIHDHDLRTEERELSLRKEVYMAAMEALLAGVEALRRLTNLDAPYETLTEDYLEKMPLIVKVHLIANEETLRAVAEIAATLDGALMQLTARRLPLTFAKQQLEGLQQIIEHSCKRRDHILELMTQHNLDGDVDTPRFEMLSKNFEYEQSQIDQVFQQQTELQRDLITKQLALDDDIRRLQVQVSDLFVPVLVAMRKELELPFDETKYRQLIGPLDERDRENRAKAIAEIRTALLGELGESETVGAEPGVPPHP